jgi:hypothetical protein
LEIILTGLGALHFGDWGIPPIPSYDNPINLQILRNSTKSLRRISITPLFVFAQKPFIHHSTPKFHLPINTLLIFVKTTEGKHTQHFSIIAPKNIIKLCSNKQRHFHPEY